jgi:hypothetical protein
MRTAERTPDLGPRRPPRTREGRGFSGVTTMTNLGTIIANGTMQAFALHSRGKDIDVTDAIVEAIRTEAKAALASIIDMGEDLANMGEAMIRHAINVECNAAAARVISANT